MPPAPPRGYRLRLAFIRTPLRQILVKSWIRPRELLREKTVTLDLDISFAVECPQRVLNPPACHFSNNIRYPPVLSGRENHTLQCRLNDQDRVVDTPISGSPGICNIVRSQHGRTISCQFFYTTPERQSYGSACDVDMTGRNVGIIMYAFPLAPWGLQVLCKLQHSHQCRMFLIAPYNIMDFPPPNSASEPPGSNSSYAQLNETTLVMNHQHPKSLHLHAWNVSSAVYQRNNF